MSGVADWLRDVTGCQSVHAGEVLDGATTATVQGYLAIRADGTVEPVVVKVYDLGIEGVGADDVRRDAAAMTAAAEIGVRAPLVVDADPDGSVGGAEQWVSENCNISVSKISSCPNLTSLTLASHERSLAP